MISAQSVVHKKVEGRLIVVTKPGKEVEKMKLVAPPDMPFLAFLSTSDPVYIPFKTIGKLQSSVQGSKVTLFKFDILPAFTSPSASASPMPANFIFNFTGPNAETNRETVKKALPNFPYVEPPPDAPIAATLSSLPPSPEKMSAMQIDPAIPMPTSSPTTKSITSPFKSPLSNQISQEALERAILASPSSQSSKKQRERRVERLRKDERLRLAYHDLVISPPHIYSDEEFWLTYAWDSNDQEDGAEAEDGLVSKSASSGPSSTGNTSKPVSDAAKTAVAQIMDQEPTRSIENELEAGSGFLDLLMKNFVDGRLKLVLTPALRKQIYEEYPMVRIAYDARVPSLMTPAAFWDTFFKAQLGKLMRKKVENETEKTKKRTKSKSAKSTSAKASATAAPAAKPEMTKEERETLFFEKLTEATPAQLDALVWQSRASDTLSHDPSKSSHSTSRKSLLSYFAEDDATKPTETKNFGTSAPSVYDASPELPVSKSTKKESSMDLTKEDEPQDPIAQQKARLKQRIAQLSRSSMSSAGSASNGNQFTSYRSEPSQRPTETGAITSEEMLFSALQEQTSLENSSKKSKKSASAGSQSVMATWYGGTENGANGDPLAEKPSDAVELLDGIIVEAGELDDSSWTELKREREKRNRHLQLIRKFNRHGHIVVSSASHASEVEESGEGAHKEEDTSEVTTSGRSLRVKSSPTKVKREIPIPLSQTASTSDMDVDESNSQNDFKPIPFPQLSSESATTSYSMEAPSQATQTKTWTTNHATRTKLSTTVVPPSHAFDQVQSELEKWTSTTYTAPPRLKADRSVFAAGKKETNNSMEIDLGEFNGLLSKIDQWKRHFWNIVERFTSATEGTAEAQRTQAAGIEKLAPVVSKLQEFMDLISEMTSFLESSAKGSEMLRETQEMSSKLQRQKEAVQRCLVIYSKLNPGRTMDL